MLVLCSEWIVVIATELNVVVVDVEVRIPSKHISPIAAPGVPLQVDLMKSS